MLIANTEVTGRTSEAIADLGGNSTDVIAVVGSNIHDNTISGNGDITVSVDAAFVAVNNLLVNNGHKGLYAGPVGVDVGLETPHAARHKNGYLASDFTPYFSRTISLTAPLPDLIMFPGPNPVRPKWPLFFLGAGFTLLETKSLVHMALLFGSTWFVNSVVFFAILVMVLAGNLYVLAVRPRKLRGYYVLLVVSLLLNIIAPTSRFLALPGWAKILTSCTVVFVPVFFARVVFGTLFRDSAQPDIDFGSNIAGIILGGLCESFSLIIGFNYLLIVALGFYVLTAAISKRSIKALGATVAL